MEILKGLSLLGIVFMLFSIFSIKAPKGDRAMSGLAGAAVATFLIEAVHKYISGDFLGIAFLGNVGATSGSMGGPIAAILCGIYMGANPIYAVVAGAATAGMGILPGFFAGYLVGLISPYIEEKLPQGLDIIIGALLIAPFANFIAVIFTPLVDSTMSTVGSTIVSAANQSPIVMGFLLGGIIKMLCTSPLSSMAITAILGLDGLAMGIASIACVGGAFTNGIIFSRLKFGDKSNIIAVMLEPLTQADIVTKNPIPIYSANFLGGGLAGLGAAKLHIINNAPGTASPIPGLLAPFAFNDPINVILAIVLAIMGGIVGGYVVSSIVLYLKSNKNEKRSFAFSNAFSKH